MDVTGVISAGVTDTDASNCNTAADDRPEMPVATVKDDTTAPTTEAADAKGTTAPPQNTGSGEVDEAKKSEEQEAPVGTGNPYKKRKVAVYMAYVGEGYRGMQHNPGSKTIEGELMHAMVKAGAVSEDNSDAFEKVNWKRAARTDKGVSAVGNVVSLRMTLHPPCMVERINEQLPEQIRILGFKRTTGGFDARMACDRRRYEYILPVWAFDPQACNGRDYYLKQEARPRESAGTATQTEAVTGAVGVADEVVEPASTDCNAAVGAGTSRGGQNWDEKHGEAETVVNASQGKREDGLAAAQEAAMPSNYIGPGQSSFCMGPEELKRLNLFLGKFIGTHNFHNFTVQVSPHQAASKRHIVSFQADLIETQGLKYVRIVVLGQSFMMHQIRKMIGMVVAVMRGIAPDECMELALTHRDCITPMAPALGLFLLECMYKSYNERWAGEEGREALGTEEYSDAIEDFKQTHIYPHIVSKDREEAVNENWLRSLNEANYKFSTWKDKPEESKKTKPPPSTNGNRGGRGGYKGKRPRYNDRN